jgi:hypothetical protein
MFYVYLFSLIVGGGLLVFSFIGVDDLGDSPDAGAHGDNPVQWLSLRNAMYFLFVFGGIGAILSRTWPSATAPLIAALAVGGGLAIGSLAGLTFNYLRRTESGYRTGDESFVGLPGRVTLPFGESGTGKVLVTRGTRTFELLARPFGAADGNAREWRDVVVVEIDRGTALVAPIDSTANPLQSLDTP